MFISNMFIKEAWFAFLAGHCTCHSRCRVHCMQGVSSRSWGGFLVLMAVSCSLHNHPSIVSCIFSSSKLYLGILSGIFCIPSQPPRNRTNRSFLSVLNIHGLLCCWPGSETQSARSGCRTGISGTHTHTQTYIHIMHIDSDSIIIINIIMGFF